MTRYFILVMCLFSSGVFAAGPYTWEVDNGSTSWFTPCFPLWSPDGTAAVTGITNATSNLRVSLIGDNEATWTDITGSDIETVSTIGTYDAPTANSDIGMDECESEGWYQLHFHDDHLAKSSVTWLSVIITDNDTLFSDVAIGLDQNPVTTSDITTALSTSLTSAGLDHWAVKQGTCDSGSTTTCVDATLTQADDDWFVGQCILFTSGTLDLQRRPITGFTASSDTITFETTTAAAVTHTYLIHECSGGATAGNLATVDSNVDLILADTGTDGVVVDAGSLATDAVQEIWDHVIDGTLDAEEMLCYITSILVNKSDYDDVDTGVFRNAADDGDMITVTYSSSDRTAVTLAACGS